MQPESVVPGDPAKDGGAGLGASAVVGSVDQFDFEGGEEALGDGVVQTRAGAAHGAPQPQPLAGLDAGGGGVFSPPLSVWKIVVGMRARPRVATAASRAQVTSRASWWLPIDQPSRCREAKSSTLARYSQPSSVGIQVTSPHQATSTRSGSNSRPSRSGAGAAP